MNNSIDLATKWGFSHGLFASMPTLPDYYQLKDEYTQQGKFIKIDIEAEFNSIVQDPSLALVITSPCLGFCDPINSYSASVQFALPISLNGKVADQTFLEEGRFKAYATDIMGNYYPLLVNSKGMIDYEAIAKTLDSHQQIFTALKNISFIFDSSMLLAGEDLFPLKEMDELNNCLEMFLGKEFLSGSHFSIGVIAPDHTLISNRVVEPNWSAIEPIEPKIAAAVTDGQLENRYLAVDANLGDTIIRQASIEIIGTNTNHQQDTFKAMQIVGLSEIALTTIVQSMVSFNRFKQQLLNSEQTIANTSQVNRYDLQPDAVESLYNEITKGVSNNSVPLFALSQYFAKESSFTEELMLIDDRNWSKSDQLVFEQFKQTVNSLQLGQQDVLDSLDGLLAFGIADMPIQFPLADYNGEIAELDLQISFAIEQSGGQQIFNTSVKPGLLGESLVSHGEHINPFLAKEHDAADINFNEVDAEQSGATYHIALGNALQAADVITDFNLAANDKIDLSHLLQTLGNISQTPATVYTNTTEQGDTEIWVKLQAAGTEEIPNDLHVATLVGLSQENGTLPGDLTSFIETL